MLESVNGLRTATSEIGIEKSQEVDVYKTRCMNMYNVRIIMNGKFEINISTNQWLI